MWFSPYLLSQMLALQYGDDVLEKERQNYPQQEVPDVKPSQILQKILLLWKTFLKRLLNSRTWQSMNQVLGVKTK